MRKPAFFVCIILAAWLLVPASALADPTPSEAKTSVFQDPFIAAIEDYAQQVTRSLGAMGYPIHELMGTPPDVQQFKLVEVASSDADQYMPVADGRNGIPDILQGIWWMDGNPLPDELLSFGLTTWDVANRKTTIDVYGEHIWTWHGNLRGRALYEFVRRVKLVYEIELNEAQDFVLITPIIHLGKLPIRIPPEVVKFTARLVGDGHFVRESYLYGKKFHEYDLRRVVRSDGTREEAFDAYVKQAPPRTFIAERVR